MGIRFNGHNINLNNIKKVRIDGHTVYSSTISYDITTNITNGSYSGATHILAGGTAVVRLSANFGYTLPASISVIGASYTYSQTGEVILSNPTGNVTINAECVPIPMIQGLKLTSIQDGSSIAYQITGTITANIQTSSDGLTWNAWDGTAITLNNGECRYIRNTTNNLSIDSSNYFKFVMTGKVNASGNLNSMINYASISTYCFYALFNVCTALTSLGSLTLPATTLATYCYNSMFSRCTGLTSLGSLTLPATTLATYCYRYMFNGCTALTSLGSLTLPATTLAESCYLHMFHGCTGLTSLGSLTLPATTLAKSCYFHMFNGCTALTSLGSLTLPATTLATQCYVSMFNDCTALTSLGSLTLPATTLATQCYASMFNGCSALKFNEDGASGTELLTTPATIPTDATKNMFSGTAGSFTGTPTANHTYKWYL